MPLSPAVLVVHVQLWMVKEARRRHSTAASSSPNVGLLFVARRLCFSALVLRCIARPVIASSAGGAGLNCAPGHTQTINSGVHPPSRGSGTGRRVIMDGVSNHHFSHVAPDLHGVYTAERDRRSHRVDYDRTSIFFALHDYPK